MTYIIRHVYLATKQCLLTSTWYAAAILLAFHVEGHGAQPVYCSTSNDLARLAEPAAFQDVIQILVYRKNGEKVSCSAARGRIDNLAIPVYTTAAHCIENAMSIWYGMYRAKAYIIHPLYELNPLADVAVFTLPTSQQAQGGYSLAPMTGAGSLSASLVSVGYGKNAQLCSDPAVLCHRQAFYPGKVKYTESVIAQQLESHAERIVSRRMGIATEGDSGGPLLQLQPDGSYAIVGITSLGGLWAEQTHWVTIDADFINAFTRVFARQREPAKTLQNLTSEAKQFLLQHANDSWETIQTQLQSKATVQNALAQRSLGTLFLEGSAETHDMRAAFPWLRKAAEQGFSEAQYNLATLYLEGKGVAQHWPSAFQWYQKAAQQGYAPAQYNLATLYFDGKGTRPDWQEAFLWFRRAAEQGYAKAQYNLATMYYRGESVRENKQDAFYWFKQAAELGHRQAQFNLGAMYFNGEGVVQSAQEAYYWLEKAAAQGHPDAQKMLNQ